MSQSKCVLLQSSPEHEQHLICFSQDCRQERKLSWSCCNILDFNDIIKETRDKSEDKLTFLTSHYINTI